MPDWVRLAWIFRVQFSKSNTTKQTLCTQYFDDKESYVRYSTNTVAQVRIEELRSQKAPKPSRYRACVHLLHYLSRRLISGHVSRIRIT